ncbi:MAG TPA: trimethylamine methyltransferase family protein [Anaerolineales bacterium]|nr:trimethylamine methyltransferase family protein [Anaerolineales bacterium]
MNFEYITKEEILKVHQASLRVLHEVGILLDDPKAFTLLMENGAKVLDDRVLLPPDLILKCLQSCPSNVVLRGRKSEIQLGSGWLHVHNLGGARDVLDEPGSNIRPATSDDVAQSARLLDALENVDTITPLYTPRDVPPHMMVLTMFDQTIRNTTKPINGPGVTSVKEVEFLAEMCRVVFGEQPAISLGASPVSPLNFKGHIAPVMLEIARQNLPFGPLPCPSVGATSPMSLAGSLVQQNAEILASIVLAQLVHPGLPIIYCGRLSVLNMRNGAPVWGNPEVGMLSAGTVQLGHYYNLPVNVYGLAGSGYAADIQSGYERAMNALVPALAGADELSGVGEMAGGTISSHAQIVVDNDIYGMVRRILRGYSVDQDSLAIDVIAHVMETNHNFLSEKHTRQYLRAGEIWRGRLELEEVGWDMWQAAGAPTAMDRANRIARQILEGHDVEPLSEEQTLALDEIMENASQI